MSSRTTRTKRTRKSYTFNLHKFKDDLELSHNYIVVYKDVYYGSVYVKYDGYFLAENVNSNNKKNYKFVTEVAKHFGFKNTEMFYRNLYIEDPVELKSIIRCPLISRDIKIKSSSSFWKIRKYVTDNNNKVRELKYRKLLRTFKKSLLDRLDKYREVSVERVEMRIEREGQLRRNHMEIETKEEEYENTSLLEIIEIKLRFLRSQKRRGLISNEDHEKFKNKLLEKIIDL